MTSPNAPAKRDVLGTLLLSVLSGHKRYAHITGLRGDGVNPHLLGMKKVVSEDAVRRFLKKIEEGPGVDWLQRHLDYCTRPLLREPWILDVDTTIKPLYGKQEGAVVGYNPHTLLIHGARAALPHLAERPDALGRRLRELLARAHRNVVVVALANKLARFAWAVLSGDQPYRARTKA